MRITTRIDYLDLDGTVIFSDRVVNNNEQIRNCDADDRIWDVIWYGIDNNEDFRNNRTGAHQ